MVEFTQADQEVAEVFPILWSTDVGAIADWAVATLWLTESWRADEHGIVEHAELHWVSGKVSINIQTHERKKNAGVALRLGSRATVDEVYQQATNQKAKFSRELEESVVAYGFTVLDPDDNEWWVHVETGMLDQLRNRNTNQAQQ